MNKESKIYIAGHRGMVGSAIHRLLLSAGYTNIIVKTSSELDLRNQAKVQDFFNKEKPEYVFLAAAKVGGIVANRTYKADFIYDNLMIQTNVIHAAYHHGVKKLLFLGSSCVYPKLSPQPIKEEYLLTGSLEPTNDAYAIAKIAGIKMCQSYKEQHGANFVSVMPTNLYGPNDNYDLQNSHVLPALIRKYVEAKEDGAEVTLWGTGAPKREFLHVDDLAKACLLVMLKYNESEVINIGTGEDVSIKDLATLIQGKVGYKGETKWDTSKPDGTPRKLMDVSRIVSLGWRPSMTLEEGVVSTINDFYQKHRS